LRAPMFPRQNVWRVLCRAPAPAARQTPRYSRVPPAAFSPLIKGGALLLSAVNVGATQASTTLGRSAPGPRRPSPPAALVTPRRPVGSLLGGAGPAHRRGAAGMKDGGADAAGRLDQRRVVAAHVAAGQILGGLVLRERGLRHDPAREPDAIGCHATVFVGGQI